VSTVSMTMETPDDTRNGYLARSVAVSGRHVMFVIFSSLCLTDKSESGV